MSIVKVSYGIDDKKEMDIKTEHLISEVSDLRYLIKITQNYKEVIIPLDFLKSIVKIARKNLRELREQE